MIQYPLLAVALFIHFGITSHYHPDEDGNMNLRSLKTSIEASLWMEFFCLFFFFISSKSGDIENPLYATMICIMFYPLDFLFQFLFRSIRVNLMYQLIKGIILYKIITTWLGV